MTVKVHLVQMMKAVGGLEVFLNYGAVEVTNVVYITRKNTSKTSDDKRSLITVPSSIVDNNYKLDAGE